MYLLKLDRMRGTGLRIKCRTLGYLSTKLTDNIPGHTHSVYLHTVKYVNDTREAAEMCKICQNTTHIRTPLVLAYLYTRYRYEWDTERYMYVYVVLHVVGLH